MILLKVLGLGSLFIAGLLKAFGMCFTTCLAANASLEEKTIESEKN